jgi:luciferase family oxidoreductase group 1
MTTHALQRDRSRAMPDDFTEQLAELLAYYEDKIPASNPLARLAKVLPGRPEVPEVWLLGSSPQSALWAADLGLRYAFADFINPNGAEIARMYQQEFAEELRLPDPHTAVAVWAVCADTDGEAQKLATSSRMTFTLLRQGRLIPVPPPDVAERFLAQQGDWLAHRRRTIVGAPETVKAGIEAAVAEYGAEEAIVVTITYDHAARRRSYELIAEAFSLSAPSRTSTTRSQPIASSSA